MTLKNTIPLILIAFLFAGMSFYLYQLKTENKGLKQGLELVNEELERQKETYQSQFDSISVRVASQNEIFLQLKNQVPALEKRIEYINRKSNENKNVINRITNADSLSVLLTNRYRQ